MGVPGTVSAKLTSRIVSFPLATSAVAVPSYSVYYNDHHNVSHSCYIGKAVAYMQNGSNPSRSILLRFFDIPGSSVTGRASVLCYVLNSWVRHS